MYVVFMSWEFRCNFSIFQINLVNGVVSAGGIDWRVVWNDVVYRISSAKVTIFLEIIQQEKIKKSQEQKDWS